MTRRIFSSEFLFQSFSKTFWQTVLTLLIMFQSLPQYSFPEFICRHHMLHEKEAILRKLQTNRYLHVIFDTLKSTALRYSITWISLMSLSFGSILI